MAYQVLTPIRLRSHEFRQVSYTEFDALSFSGISFPVHDFSMLIAYKKTAGTATLTSAVSELLSMARAHDCMITQREKRILIVDDGFPQAVMLDKRYGSGNPLYWNIGITGQSTGLMVAVAYWHTAFSSSNP